MLFAAAPVVALAGCDTIGNPLAVLSAKREGPDEFQVLARKELRMPGTTSPEALPAPQPGTPSPLEPDPQGDAVAALTGSASVPATVDTGPSRSEAALIAAADAGSVDAAEAARLARRTERAEAEQPYEPPTLLELFGAGSDEIDADLRLDPVAEATRLQAAGIPAPNDPKAEAAPVARERPTVNLSYTDEIGRGRPNNTIASQLELPDEEATEEE